MMKQCYKYLKQKKVLYSSLILMEFQDQFDLCPKSFFFFKLDTLDISIYCVQLVCVECGHGYC